MKTQHENSMKNDPAFPTHSVWDNDNPRIGWIDGGLTKREYIAALAMQGYLASYPGTSNPIPDSVAEFAVKAADALLAELEKTK